MNAEDSLKLARRFIGLPLEKRQLFLQALQKEGVDFSRFPIPAGVEVEDRQAALADSTKTLGKHVVSLATGPGQRRL